MIIKEIPWDEFPEATHYTPAREDYYAAFWRVVGDKAVDVWVLNTFYNQVKIEHFTETFSTDWKTAGIERPACFIQSRSKEMEIEDLFEVVYYAQTRLKIQEVIDIANILYEAGFRKAEGGD